MRILKRSFGTNATIMPAVKKSMNAVEKNGDAALLSKYQERCGKTYAIAVTKREIVDAYRQTTTETIQALKQMRKNITA